MEFFIELSIPARILRNSAAGTFLKIVSENGAAGILAAPYARITQI